MKVTLSNIESTIMEIIGELRETYPKLTRVELIILAHVRRGRTSREIASHLDCSIRNIENHRYRIGKKMQGRDRLHLLLNNFDEPYDI
jgi:DNA-binding CsgD family transcriptional regulator